MQPIQAILLHRSTALAARILLTFPFWGSGLAKLIDFRGGMAEMAMFNLHPAWAYNTATLVVQLAGSALIVAGRAAWFGAGMLAVFTVLTIPIAHAFWAMEGGGAVEAFHIATEHVGMIGALIVAAILAQHTTPVRSRALTALR